MVEKHSALEQRRKNIELFDIAYKEYLDSIGVRKSRIPFSIQMERFLTRSCVLNDLGISLLVYVENGRVMSVGWYLVRLLMFLGMVVGIGHV